MAYRDYLHCRNCDCKLLYDGHQSIREYLENTFGNPSAPDYTPLLTCPSCIATLQSDLDSARAELARAKLALIAAWVGNWFPGPPPEQFKEAEARYAREIAAPDNAPDGLASQSCPVCGKPTGYRTLDTTVVHAECLHIAPDGKEE